MNDRDPNRPEDATARPVSVVTGDRLCMRCGYNLVGQNVIREPHYQLLAVRCPECATVSAVQEYPLLGPWGRRWGALAALLFCLFLLGMYFASAGILFGWSTVAGEEASWNYQQEIEQRFNTHVMEQQEAQRQAAQAGAAASGPGGGAPSGTSRAGGATVVTGPGQVFFSSNAADFQQWWSQQDAKTLLRNAGGWARVLDRDALWAWLPAWIFAFAIGWFWSIALLQVKRRWVLVFGTFILGMSAVFGLIMISELMSRDVFWAGQAARRQIAPLVMIITLAGCLIPMSIGAWLGRPLTRLIVRALLPPGVRTSLSLLWTAERLQPPGVGARG